MRAEGDRQDRPGAVNGGARIGAPPPIGSSDDNAEPSFFEDPRRLAVTGVFVLLMFAAIYFLLPN
ncbi:MAG: hypothetical protein H0V25_10420, partial [Solirubrobacterales bacterium]|nr:hypothetical protein [Solirubrobacterales bacterium]